MVSVESGHSFAWGGFMKDSHLFSGLIKIKTAVLFMAFILIVPGLAQAKNFEWKVAEPAEVGIDSKPLDELKTRILSNPGTNIHSILIVKDGKLVMEEYFSGPDQSWGTDLGIIEYDKDKLHDMRSVTKSITSALIGMAIAEGEISGVGANAHELFPEYQAQMAPDKETLTLQHILTMSAGLDWFEPIDYTNP